VGGAVVLGKSRRDRRAPNPNPQNPKPEPQTLILNPLWLNAVVLGKSRRDRFVQGLGVGGWWLGFEVQVLGSWVWGLGSGV